MKRLVIALSCLWSAFLMAQSTLPNNTGSSKYVVFAWNDLGMHCLNPTYDQAVILPPYNNVKAQVVQRGNPPVIVTSGLSVAYSILGNTTSANKASFGQFWANAYKLFGASPAIDHGLNLVDPMISNGLSGSMVVQGSRFAVDGIPVTPINDAGVWNPYQTGIITVKDGSGATVASTNIIVPTSDEINCAKCHGTTNPFRDIMQKHDAKFSTNLSSRSPVLCASCHGSPALGQTGPGSSGSYMSQAIHASHANRGASCYDCHPGATTKCNRSLAHTDSVGACTNCHGSMANVAATIIVKGRVPWADEPACTQCHTNVPGVDTGTTRFRDANGHGQMACVACHNSPHAMLPSREAGDSYTTIKYQGAKAAVKTIGSCGACHSSNHGDGYSDWNSEHGGSTPQVQSACSVCHTGFQNPTQANFPHQFQWNTRTATVGSGPVKNVPVVETALPGTGAPAITTQPQSRTVTAGQTATFSVVATGTAPIAYQWRRNGVAITGAIAASYTTPVTTLGDSGSVFVVILVNSVGTVTSAPATLTVQPSVVFPALTTQPASQTVTAGQSATFSVTASGTAPLAYQWRKNGSAIPGATGASYTTAATVASDSGSLFTVVVSNSAGSVTSSPATLTVRSAPRITTQPASQTVAAGQSATFSVTATGTAPITYQWRKNGVAIAGATAASYTTPATSFADNGAGFDVVLVNAVGTATSSSAAMTVLSPPQITTQPTSLSVQLRSTATFSVVATGTAPLSYQWFKNGVALAGATASTYSFVVARSDNNASIYVAVRNQLGAVNSNTVTLRLLKKE